MSAGFRALLSVQSAYDEAMLRSIVLCLVLPMLAHGRPTDVANLPSLGGEEENRDLQDNIPASATYSALLIIIAIVIVVMCVKSANQHGNSRRDNKSKTCCSCLRARQSRSVREGASLRTPLQSTPAVSPMEPPVTHYQVPTVATATVVSAHGSDNTDYAYTDITNHPPQPDDLSGPMYSELLHQPPRTHGNSDLSYADPADMVFDGDQQAVYDPVCPTSPSYDVPALEEYSSVSRAASSSTGYSTVFKSTGRYVPTEEERQLSGNYEVQYPTKEQKHQYNKLRFFKEDKVYWAPASTASALYAQLAAKRYREIPRPQMILLEEIGSGNFAKICKGLWSCDTESMVVAVKSLKEMASESDKIWFLQEAAIMGQFWHPNVVSLHGMVTVGEPCHIVMEYMSSGDLLKYLQSFTIIPMQHQEQIQKEFLRFAFEIANGMSYLAKKKFVHRDLAARNVFLDANMTCKIGDFGMARDLSNNAYYKSRGGRIPVKWTAPEALNFQKYSKASDVWSYGMVLYEIWSLGESPFRHDTVADVILLHRNRKGYCQPPPPGTPRCIYKQMILCWDPDPKQRPSFVRLCQSLSQPEDILLSWTDKDLSLSEGCSQLGADHTKSQHLYLDLQRKYGIL